MNATTQLLHTEQENIVLELDRIEMDKRPDLHEEYQRRYAIVADLIPLAVMQETVVEAVEQKLHATEMLLLELTRARRDNVDDVMLENLHIDHDYLTGLLKRIRLEIAAERHRTPLFEMPRWW